MNQNSDFYKDPKWLNLREKILQRDKYMDQYLNKFGKFKAAEIVHHIFPREDFPEYAFSAWNLISVSKKTHNRFHNRNSDTLTKEGKELLIRTARKNNISVPYEYLKEKRNIKNDRYFYDPAPSPFDS